MPVILGTLYKCIQTDTGRKVSMVSFPSGNPKEKTCYWDYCIQRFTNQAPQTDRQTDRERERDTHTPSAAETSVLSLELSAWPSRHSSVVRLTSMMSCWQIWYMDSQVRTLDPPSSTATNRTWRNWRSNTLGLYDHHKITKQRTSVAEIQREFTVSMDTLLEATGPKYLHATLNVGSIVIISQWKRPRYSPVHSTVIQITACDNHLISQPPPPCAQHYDQKQCC